MLGWPLITERVVCCNTLLNESYVHVHEKTTTKNKTKQTNKQKTVWKLTVQIYDYLHKSWQMKTELTFKSLCVIPWSCRYCTQTKDKWHAKVIYTVPHMTHNVTNPYAPTFVVVTEREGWGGGESVCILDTEVSRALASWGPVVVYESHVSDWFQWLSDRFPL